MGAFPNVGERSFNTYWDDVLTFNGVELFIQMTLLTCEPSDQGRFNSRGEMIC
jgi:hypothetical protein